MDLIDKLYETYTYNKTSCPSFPGEHLRQGDYYHLTVLEDLGEIVLIPVIYCKAMYVGYSYCYREQRDLMVFTHTVNNFTKVIEVNPKEYKDRWYYKLR
jgi:hypothetical protein